MTVRRASIISRGNGSLFAER